ncbi:tetratricopeptide repeat protein [Sandarakinorhabdus sp.]|uniref:tetratricopeptide repeat protein n=1 Tax=Sandarakinorhabdus sp. TaxID=1916663 RepID=UPI00286D6E23|nr:tetratricopeptide repeat protein [Sandarakinorhabdus sp.]
MLILLCLIAAPLHAQAAGGDDELAAPCRDAAESAKPSRTQIGRCDRVIRLPGLPVTVRLAMLMNRGIALLRAGKLAKAESDFDLAIRSAPGLAEAWINKGVVVARQPGREREAVALISHGIDIGPKEPARAYFARAQALEVAGRLKEAMDDYAAAARADPDWPAPAEELKRFRVERRKVLRG